MNGLKRFWGSGIVGKGVIILAGFVALCCAPLMVIGSLAPKPVAQPTQAAALAAPLATAVPTVAAVDTTVPTVEATATIAPSATAIPVTDTPAPPTRTPRPTIFRPDAGAEGKLVSTAEKVIVVTNDAAWDAVMAAVNAHDTETLAGLALSGDVILVPTGTKVSVIDTAVLSVKVRISEGQFSDQSGWISKEMIGSVDAPIALAPTDEPTTEPTTEPTKAPVAVKPAKPTAQPRAAVAPARGFDNNGDGKVTCADFSTQAEARQALAAGYTKLDREGDGIPCETLP